MASALEPRLKKTIIKSYRMARHLMPRRRPDGASSLDIRRFGSFEIAYRRRTADEQVIDESLGGLFFSNVPEYQPHDGDVIVDVGAHIGTFALASSTKVGSVGHVHAIEASEDSFNMLRINVALNRADNVSAYHLAMTDRNGMCTLYHDSGNWGHSTVKQLSDSSEETNCCTLTRFFEANGIQQCAFMKLNCEGGEFPILLSTAPGMLRRIRTMLVLYHCDLWERNTPADLVAHLERSGFHCRLHNCSDRRGWLIAAQ